MQATRRTLLAGIGAAFALSATGAAAQSETPDWASMTFLDSEDRSFRLPDSPAPYTLITLWAHWCGICLRELDTVGAVAPALGADRLRVILVSHPDDWERNQAIIRRRGLALPCARVSPDNAPSLLNRALLSADGTFYVPRSVLFSRTRNAAVWSHVGGLDWRRPDTIDRMRRLAA